MVAPLLGQAWKAAKYSSGASSGNAGLSPAQGGPGLSPAVQAASGRHALRVSAVVRVLAAAGAWVAACWAVVSHRHIPETSPASGYGSNAESDGVRGCSQRPAGGFPGGGFSARGRQPWRCWQQLMQTVLPAAVGAAVSFGGSKCRCGVASGKEEERLPGAPMRKVRWLLWSDDKSAVLRRQPFANGGALVVSLSKLRIRPARRASAPAGNMSGAAWLPGTLAACLCWCL